MPRRPSRGTVVSSPLLPASLCAYRHIRSAHSLAPVRRCDAPSPTATLSLLRLLLRLLTLRSSQCQDIISPGRSRPSDPPSPMHSLSALPQNSSKLAAPHHIAHACSVYSAGTVGLTWTPTCLSNGNFINQFHFRTEAAGTNSQVPASTCFCWRSIQARDIAHAMSAVIA
jgi:hypothetical protein